MNIVALIGRLTKDPELQTVHVRGEDRSKVELRIAVPRPYGSDEADFFTVECWGKVADTMATYGKVGREVSIEGRLRHEEWTADDERRSKVLVRAQSVRFLDAPSTAQDAAEDDYVDPSAPASEEHAVF